MNLAAPSLSLRRYGASPGSHAHEHYQLLWGWQGVLELELQGRGHRIAHGEAVVIAPGERHDFEAPRGSRCFVVDAPAQGQKDIEALCGRVLRVNAEVRHLLSFLEARAAAGLDARLSGPAAALLIATLPRSGEVAAHSGGRRIDWVALDAWIDAHLAQPASVAQLAALAFLSPSQFAARCLQETGLAPMAYLRRRRLDAALRMRAQGWPVARVAAACGYRSPSALTAALRRH